MSPMLGELEDEEIKTYKKVGNIASEVLEKAKSMVEPDMKLFDIAENVEEMIKDKGAQPAFPCNVSVNENAAHYSPPLEDENQVEDGDLVKVDIGAHIDGYIADTAVTVCAGEDHKEREQMITAVENVLREAISVVEPGVDVGQVGAVIERVAEQEDYKPVSNLTGHNLRQWSLHGGVSIPNVEEETDDELKEGDVIALEPFITDGKGEVESIPEVYIFRYTSSKDVSGRMSRQTLKKIQSKYGNLPFAERWLARDLSRIRLQMTLRELISSNALHPYYVLKEVEDGIVAQAEHTMIVTEEGAEVITEI